MRFGGQLEPLDRWVACDRGVLCQRGQSYGPGLRFDVSDYPLTFLGGIVPFGQIIRGYPCGEEILEAHSSGGRDVRVSSEGAKNGCELLCGDPGREETAKPHRRRGIDLGVGREVAEHR